MADKLDPEAAMDMTIAQVATHAEWSGRKTEFFLMEYWGEGERERPRAEDLTLRALLRHIEKHSCKEGRAGRFIRSRPPKALVDRLKEVGLTRLQTWLMPRRSVTFEMIAALPRGELLKRDAAALGTMDDEAVNHLRARAGSPTFTVAELLAAKREDIWRGYSTTSTLVLLEKLGFSPADCPFMTKDNDPRNALALDLAVSEGLTADEAKKFADIAACRNW